MIRLLSALLVFAVVAPVARAQENWEIAGEWSGGYVCNQGLTALRVSIARDVTGEGVAAIFHFGPDASNPGVPKGAYSMSGKFGATDKRLRLHAGSWINRPAGYVTVDLDGYMRGSGLYISGHVLGPGCSGFDLLREGDVPVG